MSDPRAARAGFAFRLSLFLIEAGSSLVPRSERPQWREAWLGEVWHRRRRLDAEPGSDRTQEWDLCLRSLGALSHALWLARREWRMENVLQDLRFGLRNWFERPGFTLVALLTLALGIGANSYIFSVVDGLLLRPFPYRDIDRLVVLGAGFPQFSAEERFIEAISVPDYHSLAEESETLDRFVAFDMGNRDLGGIEEPQRLMTAAFWGDPFRTLGMEPLLGRSFTAEEMDRREPVAILSHRAWQEYFAGDPGVLGKPIIVNGTPRTLVGIMPPRLLLLDTDLWLPMWYGKNDLPRSRRVLTVLARVKEGRSLTEARSELATFARRIEQDLGAEAPEYEGWRLSASPFVEVWASFVGPAGTILMGAVGFVLLIACANIAGLLLARGATRRHEMAVRAAMGAGRGRLLQQLLSESALLAIGGGLLGLVVAYWGIQLTVANLPGDLPLGGITIALNGAVLAYTFVIAVVAGLFFGLGPALQSARVDLRQSLNAEGGRSTDARSSLFMRRVFVVLQIALCLILLTGAGLLVQSFQNLQRIDPGIDLDRVLTMRITLAWERYEGRLESFFTQLLEEVQAIPGVRTAAVASQFPPFVRPGTQFQIENRLPEEGGGLPSATVTVMSPSFYRTIGLELRRGRPLTLQDRQTSPEVAVINESLAARYFPNEDPIGRRIRIGGADSDAPWEEIVGVVADSRNRGMDQEPAPEIFHSYLQRGQWSNQMFLLLRTEGEPLAMLPLVRDAVKAVDPHQPIYAITTFESRFGATLATRRIVSIVLIALAAVAMLLASMGLYGVIAYMVNDRRREFGIRMALGAGRSELMGWVLLKALTLVAVGVAIGTLGAVAAGRAMTAFLYDVSPHDPLTLGAVALLLTFSALAASLMPARRASTVDPVETFR